MYKVPRKVWLEVETTDGAGVKTVSDKLVRWSVYQKLQTYKMG